MNILSAFSDLVWPRRCAICGGEADRSDRYVCSSCLMRIPFVGQNGCCSVCARSVEGLDGEYLCESCRGPHRPHFERAGSAVRFEGIARDLLLKFKFRRCLWLTHDFADWLEAACRIRFRTANVDMVVPMPTTLYRRLDRGYNPSEVLAKELAKRLGKPYFARVLRRVGAPKIQRTLDERDRFENARGSVALRGGKSVNGQTVLVVDDVLTTGATLSACADALKTGGASHVWAMTLARSVRSS